MTEYHADIVIIGSGVAGSISACKLAEAGLKVLILEAGRHIKREDIVTSFMDTHLLDHSAGFPNPDFAPRTDWNIDVKPYIEMIGPDSINTEYLRVVGGTTWHWAANCLRFRPNDFRMKSLYGQGENWPIRYEEIEPYYCDAEAELGVAGDDAFSDGCPRSKPYPLPPIPASYCERIVSEKLETIGIPFAPRTVARNSIEYDGRSQCKGFGTCTPICPTGAQYSANVHVERAQKHGAELIANARVDRLEADNNGNISAAHITHPDGSTSTAKGKLFILAANGFESPRILMQSVSEHYPNGLANRSDQVGRNFMEHPGLVVQYLMPEPVYTARGPNTTIISHHFRDGEFRKKYPGWTFSVNNYLSIDGVTDRLLQQGFRPPELDKQLRHYMLHAVNIDAMLEKLPDPNNRLTLNWDKKDVSGLPQMQLYYAYNDYDREGFKQVNQLFERVGKTLKAKPVHHHGPICHHHPMGMTRMGDNPNSSVVDMECRSHDHANLFILSSSNFCTGGTSNPTLTIAALTLRATKTIQQQLKTD